MRREPLRAPRYSLSSSGGRCENVWASGCRMRKSACVTLTPTSHATEDPCPPGGPCFTCLNPLKSEIGLGKHTSSPPGKSTTAIKTNRHITSRLPEISSRPDPRNIGAIGIVASICARPTTHGNNWHPASGWPTGQVQQECRQECRIMQTLNRKPTGAPPTAA